jgi:hypothetical protein
MEFVPQFDHAIDIELVFSGISPAERGPKDGEIKYGMACPASLARASFAGLGA